MKGLLSILCPFWGPDREKKSWNLCLTPPHVRNLIPERVFLVLFSIFPASKVHGKH